MSETRIDRWWGKPPLIIFMISLNIKVKDIEGKAWLASLEPEKMQEFADAKMTDATGHIGEGINLQLHGIHFIKSICNCNVMSCNL